MAVQQGGHPYRGTCRKESSVATPFTPPPITPDAAPPRVTGHFFGVTIPSDLVFFDGRVPDDAPAPAAPWGEAFFSRSAYAMGLRWGWGHGRDCHPRGISGHTNTCEAQWAAVTADWVLRLIAAYRDAEQEWLHDAGPRPVCIELQNYGGTVVADPLGHEPTIVHLPGSSR